MDELFTIYSRALKHVRGLGRRALAARRRAARAPGSARSGRRRSTCCAGCCPPRRSSHVGIYASGQAYEQLLLRLMSSPLPEAREVGAMILERARAGDPELRLAGRAGPSAAASGSPT